MELWLDTTDLEIIQEAHNLEILFGVTTNPSLLAASKKNLEATLQEIIHEQEGPVAAQVVADSVKEMIAQGKKLFKISSRIIIKIPASKEGYPAIQELTEEGIPVMATAIFEPYQAYMALKLGAKYVAPYLGRIADTGANPYDSLKAIQEIQKAYGLDGKILAAGLRSMEHFTMAARLGVEAITLPKKIYLELLGTPSGTQKALDEFAEVCKKSNASMAAMHP